ncbi:MAG TPA: S41 family peptidase [Blastocatellia bacterium]|jgi:carboxyl-terminal processing protease
MNTNNHHSLCARVLRWPILAALLFFSIGSTAPALAQGITSKDRDRGRVMLTTIKNDIKKEYYDPAFHGIDIEARFKQAEEKMNQAESLGQILGIVAQVLIEFDDSHLFFIPPERVTSTEYGWQMQAVGDRCYVTAVKPGSDAEAKSLKVGDQVFSVDTFRPSRDNLWKLNYLYNVLRPQPGMRVTVASPGGQQRQVDVMAKTRVGKRVYDLTRSGSGADRADRIRKAENEDYLNRQRYVSFGDDLFIWKMPQFDLDEAGVDNMMDKARKHKALVLDLRRNPGGYEVILQRMLSYFLPEDEKIGDLKRRKETKPLMVKSRGDRAFKGKLIVLVDSESGSSAEIFARVIQLRKLGTVIGDRTAGAVMRAKQWDYQLGVDTVALYGASITDADVIMSDGKSLEKVGVTPDELLLPTAADLAAGRDPVLARAAAIAGVKLDPEKAGTFFPIEWRK